MHRAIIDKEAAAIVFGFKRFYDYIFGKEIILRTDHEPLKRIIGPNIEIPLTAASRLQGWSYFLSGFKYTVETIRSKDNGNCNALSRRLPIEEYDTDIFDTDFAPINYIKNEFDTLDSKIVAEEIQTCEVLGKVISYVRYGWPGSEKLSDEEKNIIRKE